MGTGNHNYYNPAKLLSGKNALESIPFELKNLGARKPLVLCLKRDRDAGRDGILIKSFYNSGMLIGSLVDDDFDIDGGSIVNDLYEVYTRRGCDSIICLGNGDSAAAAARLRLSIDSSSIMGTKSGAISISAPLAPCVVVPTGIPDTGVYADSLNLGGDLVVSQFMLPDVICIDPRMSATKKQGDVCVNAMSAFALSLEVLFADDNPFVVTNAAIAVKFILKYLPQVMKKPADKPASYGLLNGVVAAAMAINDSESGMCNAIAESYSYITGNSSRALPSVMAGAIADHYMSAGNTDFSGILLSLTDPDRAAVNKRDAAGAVRGFVTGLMDVCADALKGERGKLRISPDEVKKVAADAVKKSSKKYSQQAFENILLKSFKE